MKSSAGMTIHLRRIRSKRDLHPLLAETFQFPEWYGHNWDAFWDLVTSLEKQPEHILITDWKWFSKQYSSDAGKFLRCLNEWQLLSNCADAPSVYLQLDQVRIMIPDTVTKPTIVHGSLHSMAFSTDYLQRGLIILRSDSIIEVRVNSWLYSADEYGYPKGYGSWSIDGTNALTNSLDDARQILQDSNLTNAG